MTTNIRVLTDVEFLELVIEDLDDGWTTGRMCSVTGEKCLVGAGAAALGYDYRPAIVAEIDMELICDQNIVNFDNEEYNNAHRAWQLHLQEAKEYEEIASEHFSRLISEEVVESAIQTYQEERDPEDPEDMMEELDLLDSYTYTSFNDDYKEYAPLREKLVAALTRAQQKENANV